MLEEESVKGTVRMWNDDRKFGFIRPETVDDVFVHFSEIIGGSTTLTAGETVEFEIVDGPKGLKAVRVMTF